MSEINLNISDLEKILEVTNLSVSDVAKIIELKHKDEKEEKERKEREKNVDFVQIYRGKFIALRELQKKNQFASLVLLFILEHMDNRNSLVCSHALLMDYFQKSRTTVHRAIATLVEDGYIAIFKLGTSNVYTVNPELAWTDKSTNKRFSKYDGNILISHKETEDYFLSNNYQKFKRIHGLEKNDLKD